MITQEQIDAAEKAVEAAEVKLDRAEDHHYVSGGVRAANELKAAQVEAGSARDRVRRLKALWAAERAAEARRAEAEAAFPKKRREALTRRLAGARDEAAAAVAALDAAAAAALAAVASYGELVREASGELIGAGLRADVGGEDGGTTVGAARLGGEVWRAAEPGAVLAEVMRSVVAAYDQRHVFAQTRFGQMGGMAEAQARAELLARAAGR